MDLDADGYNDLVAATFEGTAFTLQGTKKGFLEPKHIKDENDELVRISMYWDLEKDEYLNVDRSVEGEKNHEDHHMTSVAMVDWDNDGDLDLIQGAYEGALYRCMNEGSKSKPKFSAKNHYIMAGKAHAKIANGLANPRVCDWNGDGLFDILCGGAKGGVYLMKNVGKAGEPAFENISTLIKPFDGETNSYGIPEAPMKDGLPTRPVTSLHIETVDYDNDGDLDLLIGGRSMTPAEKKELTDEETEKLAALKKEDAELRKKMESLFEEADTDEKREALIDSDEFNDLSTQLGELYQEIAPLSPMPSEKELVWLYRNLSSSKNKAAESIEANDQATAHAATEPAPAKTTTKMSAPDDDKLTVDGKLMTSSSNNKGQLTLSLSIPTGFHIYGASNKISPTTIKLTRIDGESVAIDLDVPTGRPVRAAGKSSYWLERKLAVEFTSETLKDAEQVEGQVAFMMCNEKGCFPPETLRFSITRSK